MEFVWYYRKKNFSAPLLLTSFICNYIRETACLPINDLEYDIILSRSLILDGRGVLLVKVKQLTLKKYLQQSAFKRNKQSHKIGSAMLIEQLFTPHSGCFMCWLLFSRDENAPAACIHVKMLRNAVIDDSFYRHHIAFCGGLRNTNTAR